MKLTLAEMPISQIQKTIFPIIAALLSLLPFFFFLPFKQFPINSTCYALEPGWGSMGVEEQSVQRTTAFSESEQWERIYHFDAWQSALNFGRFGLWLDWAEANIDHRINRLGRGFVTLREFPVNGVLLNGLAGDTRILFTNLPERFSNSTYPDIYLRGLQSDFLSGWGEVHLFGGEVAALQDMLGKIYESTGESFYGFRGSFRPLPKLLLGTGFLRTQNEVDSVGNPITKHNNIYLLDSEWEIFKNLKWLTEFRLSDFQGENQGDSQRDYNLKLGPLWKGEKFRIEANYRRIGTDYRFVNEATQVEKDQVGTFLLAEYRPLRELTLLGNGDFFHDNVDKKPNQNTTDTRRGLLGLSYFHPKYPSFYATFDRMDKKSRSDFPSPADDQTSTFVSEVRYQYVHFNPYARYRWEDFRDEINPANGFRENVFTLGLRKIFGQGSFVYVEGEEDRKNFQDQSKETRTSGKVGFYYYSSPRLSFWGEVIFSVLKERAENNHKNKIEGGVGLNWLLPWDLQLYGDIRQDSILHPEREGLNRGLQISLRLSKRFMWGRPEKVAGILPGVEVKGYGSVEGVVFNDMNRNGIQDQGEEGIKDVMVSLEDGSTVKTDEKGFYRFPRVEVGNHTVILNIRNIPAEYNIVSPGRINIEVKLRGTVQVNFRMIMGGRIEGRVINDVNSNGKWDPGEQGVSDVLVLLAPGGQNTYTDGEGRFVFENIVPGEYTLKLDPASLPEETVFTSAAELGIVIPPGGELKEKNFLVRIKPRPIITAPSQ